MYVQSGGRKGYTVCPRGIAQGLLADGCEVAQPDQMDFFAG